MSSMIKLNLGCKRRMLAGFDNLDKIYGWYFQDGLPQYGEASVDGITISHALMFLSVSELEKFTKEMWRVLKVGGVVRITEDDTENPLGDMYQTGCVASGPRCLTGPIMMREMLEKVGFTVYDVDRATTHFCDNSLMQAYRGGPPQRFFIEGVKNVKRIFLDVGAHVGETLAIALEDRYCFDKIYCFEPVTECCDVIRGLKERRVEVCEYGLWNENATAKIYNAKSKGASLFRDKFRNEVPFRTITLMRASDWFKQNVKREDVVYLKLNCEGAECAILDDLIKTNEYKKIDVLMVDFDVRKIPSQKHLMSEMKARLTTLNIPKIFYIDEYNLGRGTHSYFTHFWLDNSFGVNKKM